MLQSVLVNCRCWPGQPGAEQSAPGAAPLAPSSASPSRAVVAQRAPWERWWYQEDFVTSAVWELQHSPVFRGNKFFDVTVAIPVLTHSTYQLYNPQCFGSCLRNPSELSLLTARAWGPSAARGRVRAVLPDRTAPPLQVLGGHILFV